ncbi:SemiSWEET family sugar transporter [Alkalimarinus sediminis]|uniref:SemiSWEET family sugar transporter n=1 Tax=Alkalimarinus sediminis TaxID=1632866 RepID=UPI00363B54CA
MAYLGGFFTMISFVPQIWRCYKTKCANDLSIGMLIITLLSGLFYESYAILLNLTPVIITNSIFILLVLLLLVLKIRYDKITKQHTLTTGKKSHKSRHWLRYFYGCTRFVFFDHCAV